MEYRRVFDTIPDQFDQYRPRYCQELFDDLIAQTCIGPGKTVLELGPGTGQATDPILKTGCDYHAIELGEHLYEKMVNKYGEYPNFSIVNDDFITHDFMDQRFDLIYSAATIQWIPEEIAFKKTYSLLKPGGILAMLFTRGDYRSPNEELYQRIQQVYSAYFKPKAAYSDMHAPFTYEHATQYGYVLSRRREFHGVRVFTADEYVAYCGTHCDHLTIPEPYKSRFFDGLRSAVLEMGNRLIFWDTHVLYLMRKEKQVKE